MTEKWLPIPGWEGLYEVSDEGRVRSLDRVVNRASSRPYFKTGRVLRPMRDTLGYASVALMRNGERVVRRIAPLVAETFIATRPDGMVCRHLDGDNRNDALVNLAWGTPSENSYDAVGHGTHPMSRRTQCKHGHEFTPENTYMVRGGTKRRCRTCSRRDYAKWSSANPNYIAPSRKKEPHV